jgi:hypothetical protein
LLTRAGTYLEEEARTVTKATVEAKIAVILRVVAVLGMLFAAFTAWLYDGLLNSHWGDDGVQHIEIVEVLPHFFWFAVWFGLLLGRQGAARVLCNGRALCWSAAGAIVGKALLFMVAGDLITSPDYPDWLSLAPVHAAGHVITWLCALMGAAAGATLAWQLPERLLPAGFYRRK